MPEAGTVIGGRYRLARRIGEGATAAIWEAEHLTLGRTVAVKFLHHVGPPKSEASQRFVREARISAAIKHRNVVDILDFGLTDDDHQPYMVMERLDGRSLAEHIQATGPLPIAEAARLTSLILRGLSAVHDAGMLHRDLKPENVFLVDDEDGPFPKLLDFGLSRKVGRGDMTQEGMLLGTPDYMSPEQATGSRNLDARTDIYSMGVILYELLTGRMPFQGETLAELLANVVDEPPIPIRGVRPDVPEALAEIVERAMAKDKNARFANARDMRNALAAADLGMSISPDSGLISLSERPPPPRGVFGAETDARRRSTRGSGKIPAVGASSGARASSPEPATPDAAGGTDVAALDGATVMEVRLPESDADGRPSHQNFPRPAGVPRLDATPAAPPEAPEDAATTSPAIDVGSARREPTGARKREDSVSTFTVTARDGEPPRRGSVARTLFLLLLLVGAGGAAWWFYGEALGLGSPASLGLGGLLPVAPAPDAGGDDGGDAADGGATTFGAEGASLDAGGVAALSTDAGDPGPGDASEAALDADSAADAGVGDAGLAADAGGDAGELDEEPPARGRAARRRRRPRRR